MTEGPNVTTANSRRSPISHVHSTTVIVAEQEEALRFYVGAFA